MAKKDQFHEIFFKESIETYASKVFVKKLYVSVDDFQRH